jgi:hypothetical protein
MTRMFVSYGHEEAKSGLGHRTRNLLIAVPIRFVLPRQVLICIVKTGGTCRSVPFDAGAVVPRSAPVSGPFRSLTVSSHQGR